ncbi:MAG: TrkA family potassium uptake protein [Lachnospiraceae bacterium]|nr:TrkA family potassium uptake protein [Lachnospiraceae bacterium]
MKTFLVIGAGTFGHHLCNEFAKQKCEIMVVDSEEEHLGDLLNVVTSARIADCTNREALESLDIPSFDVCFVCLRDSFQSILVVTYMLKELGAKKVLSRASDDTQALFLKRNGADGVIYPFKEMAERLAISESNDRIFDCIPMTKDYYVYEISPRADWVGKSIKDLDFRNRFHMNILAVKDSEGEVFPNPSFQYVFKNEEHIMVLATDEDIRKVT